MINSGCKNAYIEEITGVDPNITGVNPTGTTTYAGNLSIVKDYEDSNTYNDIN